MTNVKMQTTIFRSPFIVLILMYSLLPIVPLLISSYLTTYFYMLVVLLTFFVIVLLRKEESIIKYLSVLLPFLFYNLLSFVNNSDSIVMWGYRVLLSMLPIMLGFYLVKERTFEVKNFAKMVLVFFAITFITTIIGLILFPNASRELASLASSSADFTKYSIYNVGGFEFVYAVVLLYPLLILAYKRRKINLFFTIVIAVGILFLTLLSQYTIAFILFMMSSCLFFLKKDIGWKGITTFSIIAIILIIVFNNFISAFFTFLGDNVGSEIMAERLYALAGGREGVEAMDGNRLYYYLTPLNEFIENPILGKFISGGGGRGHSGTLDTLAKYGMIGLLLMIWMYRYVFTFFYKPYSKQSGFGFIVWFFVQSILLSTLNPGFWFNVLCLFAPLILILIFDNAKPKPKLLGELEHA